MKRQEIWIIAALLGLTFLAICFSSQGWLPVPLPICILVGLGIPAGLLLWWNRRELSEILNLRQAPPREEYPEDVDLKKAA